MIKKFSVLILFFVGVIALRSIAQNPVIQTRFTADPAPLVYKDTVYLYTTHDENTAGPGMGKFLMKEWLLYTSTDMVNWTDHGVVASLKDFVWGRQDNGAWAHQCIERNGKFYLYCAVQGSGIGVLVADSPYGPFKDPIGKSLVDTDHKWNDIDPSVFIDDNGQAYLYWGNPSLWYVKLNEDMISHAGEVTKIPNVGKEKGQTTEDTYHYQEGPWAYKRNGHYYMAYASTCCPEGIGYAMSNSATGPWEYKGYIMKPNAKSSGNHPGIIDYKGKSYVFGFNYRLNFMLTEQHHERRSVCVEEFKYNPDGTIPELPWWSETGVEQIGNLNPFKRTEAETINWAEGMTTAKDIKTGQFFVCNKNTGAYIKVRGVDFGKGARKIEACVAAITAGSLEIRIDDKAGTLLGTLNVKSPKWETISSSIKTVKGKHDLYLVFKGGRFNLDWWKMKAN
ncbi:glycoside hydrolase family 43 protein [Pedobacter sp. MR22-3]|uniref:glycoside hydrolase family 43 protein n=1 Tax=Pedobacter sp. MR22-3 TaxID=2994552 RepID=UPI002246BEE4|nr:glycoside hydrolase family 43 protein [Pedobacter sp. MR22-3]MCX2583793.1 glycoside hydrolase family 43 protein [Pedobacter sp. MR22-3]